jgi:hypothetical protein
VFHLGSLHTLPDQFCVSLSQLLIDLTGLSLGLTFDLAAQNALWIVISIKLVVMCSFLVNCIVSTFRGLFLANSILMDTFNMLLV